MGTEPFVARANVPQAEAPLPIGTNSKMPIQWVSVTERLCRLEEAKVFLHQQLAAGPKPARAVLKAARAAGIASRTLHRAKDALGVTPERSGGFGAYGKWTWYPPRAKNLMISPPERPMAVRRG